MTHQYLRDIIAIGVISGVLAAFLSVARLPPKLMAAVVAGFLILAFAGLALSSLI